MVASLQGIAGAPEPILLWYGLYGFAFALSFGAITLHGREPACCTERKNL